MSVDVTIAFHTNQAVAVAHEFEHILEQIDGWNLAWLARQSGAGVRKLSNGSFETSRAIDAGETARREMLTYHAARRSRPWWR